MWIASSWQGAMQCSSLPHMSGRARTAIQSTISRHFGPHASTHNPWPVQRFLLMTGTHLRDVAATKLAFLPFLASQCERALTSYPERLR